MPTDGQGPRGDWPGDHFISSLVSQPRSRPTRAPSGRALQVHKAQGSKPQKIARKILIR
jgi:hypothetical protein